ncbi:MAG: hypothetical protein FJZ00_09520, partial [Candidatus Sericytochromatia bacterium]|nr:hypothetical protein [Candidatus Tanganyikabacteria bacterium]
MLRGQFEFAERHFAEAIALYDQIKDERSLGIALVNRGLAQIEQRRFEDARKSLAEGHRRLEAIGFYEQHVDLLLALSRLAAQEGDEAGAWQLLQQAQFHAGETRHPHLSALVSRAMGEFFLRTGRIGPAIAALEAAAKTHGVRCPSLEGARTQRELARALAADGRGAEAEAALEAARRCLEGLDIPSDLAELGVKACTPRS